MTTIRTTYEPIETRRTRAGKCPVCGRPARRTEVFRQTVNPWNRTENDVPKTREEVRASVEAAADAWVPDFRHEQCKGGLPVTADDLHPDDIRHTLPSITTPLAAGTYRPARAGVVVSTAAERRSRVYVASSWRNADQPAVVAALRERGFEVYDFRNPPGRSGFAWSDIDPRWQSWTAAQYIAALDHPLAEAGYASDFGAMQWADTFVLVLPCGRSAHLELGWAVGAGKRTVVITRDGEEPELMAKMVDHIAVSLDDALDFLGAPDSPAEGCDPWGEPCPEHGMQHWEDGAKALHQEIHDLRAALAAAGAGAAVDREALANLLAESYSAGHIPSDQGAAHKAALRSQTDAVVALLAARGDAATPTVTAEQVDAAWVSTARKPLPTDRLRAFLAALGIKVEGGEQP